VQRDVPRSYIARLRIVIQNRILQEVQLNSFQFINSINLKVNTTIFKPLFTLH